MLPSFSRDHCTQFFIKMFSVILPYKKFTIPQWIPSFNQPSFSFDQSPPSYAKVIRVIRRIKSSGSPCLLDKISIICFKRCPYLRTFLTENIRIIWESGRVPSEWKKLVPFWCTKKALAMILQTPDLSLSNLFLIKSSLHVYVILCFPFLVKINSLIRKFKKGLLQISQGHSSTLP